VPRPADAADALAVALTHLARSRLARAAAGTPASVVLAEAERAASKTAHGGWEAVLADRGLIAGPPSRRTRSPGGR
jgi:crossover junction endodeoxyribonuclease RuvC